MVTDPVVFADLTQLAANLKKAHQSIQQSSEDLLDQISSDIEELMKSYAPVLTGRLRGSIVTIKIPGMRTIGPQGVDYAGYQEFGTGIRGEFPGEVYTIRPKKGQYLVFEVDGQKVFAREVQHPGIPPNPFVRPAARASLENIGQSYAQLGARLISTGEA